MTAFDGRAYEDGQNAKTRAAGERLRSLVTLDEWGYGPPVEFLCPKGHSLKSYRVEAHSDTLLLAPLPGQAAKAGPTVSNGSPWTRGQGVCSESGCPQRLPCDQHPQQPEQLHHVRSQFHCRRCPGDGWSDEFTMARLLKIYGVAVLTRRSSVPITLSDTARRR